MLAIAHILTTIEKHQSQAIKFLPLDPQLFPQAGDLESKIDELIPMIFR